MARPRDGELRDARSTLWLPAAALAGVVAAWQALYLSSWLGLPSTVVLLAAIVLARRETRLAAGAACYAAFAAAELLIAGPNALPWLGQSASVAPLLIAATVALAWRLRPAADATLGV